MTADPLLQPYAERLGLVRDRIGRACAAAGRDPAGVTLVAVSKTRAADDVRALYRLGHRDFGENKAQELIAKAGELADLPDLRWHFIGQLQRNKAARVAGLAAAVHSVDRAALVETLDRVTPGREAPLGVLLQLSLDGDPARGGADATELWRCAELTEAGTGLALRGLMAVAPPSWPADRAFTEAAEVAARLRHDFAGATEFSAGMSHDLEPAIAAGATMVRVGTDLFGPRRYPDPSG